MYAIRSYYEGKPLDGVRRLLAQAGPAEIVVGRTTRLRVADYFRCEPVSGEESADGPVVYRVTDVTGVDSHFAASKARGLAPFLGREDELARLRQYLQRAASGAGGVAVVSGEPGVA